MNLNALGIDLVKNVLSVQGTDSHGKTVLHSGSDLYDFSVDMSKSRCRGR